MTVVYVTASVLRETGRLLASFADGRDSEGVVYWFGLELGERAVVTTMIVPDADTGTGAVRTSAAVNGEAVGVVAGTPLVLLGQAHSHPSQRVGHSRLDDLETFAQVPGALSIVVPYYGRRGMELASCGVHRHIGGMYRHIVGAHVHEHLRVLPSRVDLRDSHDAVGRPEAGSLKRSWLWLRGA